MSEILRLKKIPSALVASLEECVEDQLGSMAYHMGFALRAYSAVLASELDKKPICFTKDEKVYTSLVQQSSSYLSSCEYGRETEMLVQEMSYSDICFAEKRAAVYGIDFQEFALRAISTYIVAFHARVGNYVFYCKQKDQEFYFEYGLFSSIGEKREVA